MKLTPREKQIVALVAKGEKRSAIATALGVTIHAVDFHLVNVRRKLRVASVVELAVWHTRSTYNMS